MTSPERFEVQRAIAFLSRAALAEPGQPPLPAVPDYLSLSRRAQESGFDVSPAAVEEAFRLIMRARLVMLRTGSGRHSI